MMQSDDFLEAKHTDELRDNTQHKLPVYVNLSSFVSKKNLLHYVYCIMTVFTIITIYCIFSIQAMTTEIVYTKKERIRNLNTLIHTMDAHQLCMAVDCIIYGVATPNEDDKTKFKWFNSEYIGIPFQYAKDIIEESDGIFPNYTFIEISISSVGDHSDPDLTYIFYISNLRFLELGVSVIKDSLGVSILFILILYITIIYFIEKNTVYEKHNYKYTLENRLQRNITESLYHEMINPLSVLDTIIKDIYSLVYGDMYDKVNDVLKEGKPKYDIVTKNRKDNKSLMCDLELLDILQTYHPAISASINRLFATINLVSGVKKIKYSNGSVPIYRIIENAVSSANLLAVTKLKHEIKNSDLLQKYSVSGKLNNGDLLNVLTIMITNSLEAYSDLLEISASLTQNNKLVLHVKDNGRGIRDSNDKIVHNYGIFNYGESSKDPNLKINKLEKILNIFSLSVNKKHTTRGVGLFINKELLRKSDGDIVLIHTSPNGTQFDIILPVKKTENSKKKNNLM